MTGTANFWSRRKAGVEAEARADTIRKRQAEEAEERAAFEAQPDEVVLAELNLKDPDEMQQGDDFAAFMKAAVPERLRRRALRKLWLSNPTLANLDQLVDYGEDYTDAALAVENIQTAYQVGKGMFRHVLEMTKEETGENGETVSGAAEDSVPPETATEEPMVEMVILDDQHLIAPSAFQPESEPESKNTVKRRMRFDFAT